MHNQGIAPHILPARVGIPSVKTLDEDREMIDDDVNLCYQEKQIC